MYRSNLRYDALAATSNNHRDDTQGVELVYVGHSVHEKHQFPPGVLQSLCHLGYVSQDGGLFERRHVSSHSNFVQVQRWCFLIVICMYVATW